MPAKRCPGPAGEGSTRHRKLWQAPDRLPAFHSPAEGRGGTAEHFFPISDSTKAAVGGAGGGALGRQTPSVILGLVRCQRGVLAQQPPIGAKAGRRDFVAFPVGKVPALLSLQEPCAPGGQMGAALLASPSAAATSQHQLRCP